MKSTHSLAMCAAVLGLMAALPGSSSAQSAALQQRLAELKSLSCTFSVVATGTWTAGVPSAAVTPAQIKVSFTSINIDEGTADADVGFGGSFVVVRRANEYLHLMQIYSGGPLYTTTVLAKETTNGRLMAVHTRHEYTDVRLPNITSRPEMYLGECTPGK